MKCAISVLEPPPLVAAPPPPPPPPAGSTHRLVAQKSPLEQVLTNADLLTILFGHLGLAALPLACEVCVAWRSAARRLEGEWARLTYVRPIACELSTPAVLRQLAARATAAGRPRVRLRLRVRPAQAAVAAARASRVAARRRRVAASPTSCTRARSTSSTATQAASAATRSPRSSARLGGDASEPLAPSASSEAGAFEFPEGLALLGGSLYVADCNHHRVVLLDPTTLAQLGAFGEQGAAPGQFEYPTGVAGDDQLRLLAVADSQNHRVQLFKPGGVLVRVIGGQGCAPGMFNRPCGVAIGA